MTSDAQTSGTVLMVRPAAFGFHAEAARSNAFAKPAAGEEVAEAALREFEGLASALERAGVLVLVLDDTPNPPKPDAVFPNNWVSFHGDGTIILYPMATAARRLERRTEALKRLLSDHGFAVRRTVDLSQSEQDGQYLEGTGSLILDRPGRRAFAALGPRTMQTSLEAFADATGFDVVKFGCADREGRPIYHTNVMLSLGERFALLCAEAIDAADRERVIAAIEASGREIVSVGLDAMERFACNILTLEGRNGPVIAMSQTAFESLDHETRERLERHGALVTAPIPTIERVGGGSVRCMIADVHLPRR
ncbi:MAG: arginine deiminase-related protein [Sphingomicrobium sp.]